MSISQPPSVGRIVHYFPALETITEMGLPERADPPVPMAAIITRVFTDRCVNLVVFRSDGLGPGDTFAVTSVEDREDSPSRWAWPPRL